MQAISSYVVKARELLRTHKALRIACCVLLCLLVVFFLLFIVLHPHGEQTYLILGIDNYGSLDDNGRSDVMMLVHLDFDHSEIATVTFARDMFIENEHGTQSKINTIVRNEDEEALVRALEQNFGLSIDGWFRVNFSSVVSIVDAMGGAEVTLTAEEARYIDNVAGAYPDSPLSEGTCRLNGAQALTYARCRKLDNDIGRGQRQSKLFEGLVQQTRQMNVFQLVSVVKEMSHAWRSSLSASEQASLVYKALWLRGAQVTRLAVPFEGTWHYGNSQSGTSGIIISTEDNRQMLQEALYP